MSASGPPAPRPGDALGKCRSNPTARNPVASPARRWSLRLPQSALRRAPKTAPQASFVCFVWGPPPAPHPRPRGSLEEKTRKEDEEEGWVAGLGRFNRPVTSRFHPEFNTDQTAAVRGAPAGAPPGRRPRGEAAHLWERGGAGGGRGTAVGPAGTPELWAKAGNGPSSSASPKPASPRQGLPRRRLPQLDPHRAGEDRPWKNLGSSSPYPSRCPPDSNVTWFFQL